MNSDDGAVWLKGTIDREALVNPETGEAKINLKVGSWLIGGISSIWFSDDFGNNFEFRFTQKILMDMMLLILLQSKSMLPISMTINRSLNKNHMLDKLLNTPRQVRDPSLNPSRPSPFDKIYCWTIISIMITVSFEIYHVMI